MADTSVVAAERVDAGTSDFQEWLASLPAHREEFERHYRQYEPAEDDVGRIEWAIESVGGTVRTLIVTDPSSADDWRGVAVMAKIAEAAGTEISIIPLEGNEDLVESHPNIYDETGTPTFIFLGKDGETLGHLSRRPLQVETDINRAIAKQHGFDFALEGPEYEAAVTDYLGGDVREQEKAWRHAQLWETIAAIAPGLASRVGSSAGVLRSRPSAGRTSRRA